MSYHRVQHKPSTTASPQYCLSSFQSDGYESTPECSFSFRRASLQDRPPPASSPWELKGKVTSSQSHGCKLINWWIESRVPGTPPIDRLQVLLQSPLDHGLQVHLDTRLITASKWISELLDYYLEMHLETRSITASSESPTSVHYSLQVHLLVHSITALQCISKLTRSLPPSSHDHSFQVHLQTRSIMASKCISEYTRSWPASASLNLLDHGLQVYIWVQSIVIFRRSSNCCPILPAASRDIPYVDG